jgi:hypothetical protein
VWSLAIIGVSVASGAQPRDLASELAWLARAHGGELHGVRFTSPVAALIDWVPPGGDTVAYLFAPGNDESSAEWCSPVVLTRSTQDSFLDGTPGPMLHGQVILRRYQDEGKHARDYQDIDIGIRLLRVCTGGTEHSDDGKRWESGALHACGWWSRVGGVLSFVSRSVARWGGEELVLSAGCAGPVEPQQCSGGGAQLCNTCEQVRLWTPSPAEWRAAEQSLRPHGYLPASRPTKVQLPLTAAVCRDSCPDRSHPDIDRIGWIARQTLPWRALPHPESAPALYRSRARCLQEHQRPASSR